MGVINQLITGGHHPVEMFFVRSLFLEANQCWPKNDDLWQHSFWNLSHTQLPSLTDPEIQNTWFEDMDVARLKHHLGDGSKAMSGWWYTYPSDKYESKFGINIPKIWKVIKSSSKPPTRCGYRTKSISLSSVSPWPNIGGIPWGEGTREGTQFFGVCCLKKAF